MNLNKAILIGRLTRDPEVRTTTSGQSVTSFGLATNRVWNKDGQKQESTEFHNIVAWGRLAEICGQYLKKGALTMIEGRIATRSWQGQDGVTRYTTEVIAENLQMGPRAGQTSTSSSSFSKSQAPEKASTEDSVPSINLDEQGNPIEESSTPEPPVEAMPF